MIRLFLDTNVYILGAADSASFEGHILAWLEQGAPTIDQLELLISEELLIQVARVAKRLTNKDLAGKLVNRILCNPCVCYVSLDDDEIDYWRDQGTIPNEDIEIYLTAKVGNAHCFVSTNRDLIRALVKQTQEFECLTPEEFVQKYL